MRIFPIISILVALALAIPVINVMKAEGQASIAVEEPTEISDNLTVEPAPGTELSFIHERIRIILDHEYNRSSLSVEVTVLGESLPGKILFPDNATISFVPEHGYAYGENVSFFIKGGEDGLEWINNTPALDENLTFELTMPLPEKFLIPLNYRGMGRRRGHLTLFTEEGNALDTLESGYMGVFPLPEDFDGGFGVFDNGEESVEVHMVRYAGSAFTAWDHVALTDHSPVLMFGKWDPNAKNITFQFSHLMDRGSVEEHMDTDGLDGGMVWEGRYMTFSPNNRDPTRSYNVTIREGAETVWGEELEEEIWLRINPSEEKDRTLNYFIAFMILLIFLFGAFYVAYGKSVYEGPR